MSEQCNQQPTHYIVQGKGGEGGITSKGGSARRGARRCTCTAVLTAACRGEGSPGLSGLMAVPRSCRDSPAATPMLWCVMLRYVM